MGNGRKLVINGRHLNASEINAYFQEEKIIEKEVQRRLDALTMTDRVVNTIKATHRADMVLSLIVLMDTYEASPEFLKEYLDRWQELLVQYDDGIVNLKQMEGHIELSIGYDIESYLDKNMDLAKIRENVDER